ncbi:acyl-CoA dehydrogenase [Streptomyces viridochromogenes DSM 40736]|uniref:Acyl-CoA dehydrogenase n=1 Tax=Streptomyces viridochromogenes (strain DSM 40736 / JCM 4977 / BCRC 1201 / Tue 494) TaxID=591159 RepID=D9X737_STRVT|nr:acyl-CoA dehydrogenase family protein [Streptomyces viridochromogenes]EFL34104.1 acyl-CoA dehydrogenase [Streptomyces viridochromogenes DSM 40736]
MTSGTAPRTDTDLVERVRALGPFVREHALRAERERRVTREVVEALTATGIQRMNVPRRYGGYQSSLRTQVDALAEVSAACGSAGFMSLIQAGCAYVAALFPDEAQDEIFTGPDVRVGGTLIPGATAVPTGDGGYVVNGTSPFATGCRDADWHLLTARVEGRPDAVWTAVPVVELEILDDWRVSGLAGSGSNTVVAHDVVVPSHRVLPVGPLLGGSFASKANADDPFYRVPVLLMFCAWATPNALGLARSALAEFRERIHRRGITYSFYERQSEAPVTHLQAAEAALKISCAEHLTDEIIALLQSRAASGEPYTTEERAGVRARSGYVARLCLEAAELIGSASGASSLHEEVPIQRTVRDLRALNLHAFVHPATNLELYGRVLAGLDPGTPFL